MAEAKGQSGTNARGGSEASSGAAPHAPASLGGDRELYAGYEQLPIIKRTWVWVLAGLLILVSGIVIGLALAKLRPDLITRLIVPSAPRYGANELVLASLGTRKIRSLRRVSELETALRGNVCTASFEAPATIAGVVPARSRPGQVGRRNPASTVSAPGANAAGAAGRANGAGGVLGQRQPGQIPGQTAALKRPGAGAQTDSPSPAGPRVDDTEPVASPAVNPDSPASAVNTNPSPNSAGPPAAPSQRSNSRPSGGSGRVLKIKDLRVLLNRATVLVMAPRSASKVSIGSGFFINKNHVITNAHVIGRSRQGITITNQSLGRRLPATVIHKVYTKKLGGPDFAILKLSESLNVKPLKLTKHVAKLQEVVAAGYPGFDLSLQRRRSAGQPVSTFTRGSVRFVRVYEGLHPAISHDADIRKGNSGGPLVDVCGRVLGVNTFALRDNNEAGQAEIDFALSAVGLMQELKNQNVPFEVSQGECE